MPADPPADPHVVLGVAPGATAEQVRRAYRVAARANHPDAGGDPAAFVAVRLAFEALMAAPGPAAGRGGHPPSGASADPGPRTPRPADAPTVAAVRAAWPAARPLWRIPAGPVGVSGDSVVTGAGGAQPAVLRASARTGAIAWRAPLAAPPTAVAFDAHGPVVVVADSSSVLHGLDGATGVTRWQRPTAAVTALAATHDDGTAVATGSHLQVITGDGTVRWTVRLAGPVAWVVASPAMVLAATADTVVGVDPASGTTRWWGRWPTAGLPAVLANASLWLVDGTSAVVGLDPATGAARHRVELPHPVVGLDPVAGALAVRTADDALVVLGRGGTPRFRVLVPGGCSAPAVVAGAVAIAAGDGTVRFVSPSTGAELHWVNGAAGDGPGAAVRSRRLTAAGDGVLVVSGGDADTVAVGTTA